MVFGVKILSLSYIYISIFIFLIGWVKPLISIPTTIVLLFFIIKYIRKEKTKIEDKNPIYIDIKILILIIFIVLLVGTVLGWTGIFKQSDDWAKHNAILSDLTKKDWPVYYINENEDSMLTYYLGQYIFPALIGKIFSSVIITQAINGIWAMLGIFIAILHILKITDSNTSKKQIITLLITLLFSTCIGLSQVLGKIFIADYNIQDKNWFMLNQKFLLQYSSNITLLRWVMPQVIIPWICMGLLYDDKYDLKNYILLFLPVVFYSTLPFISLAVILIILAIIKFIKEKNKLNVLKELFSLSNIFILLTLGTILILYFYGNVFLDKPDEIKLKIVNYGQDFLVYIFFILSFLPYTILLFKENRKNVLYWISTIFLVILPFFTMGLFNDLLMRVSIIPLFVYMILCIKTLYNNNVNKIIKAILIIFMIIGSYTSINEIFNSFAISKNSMNITLEHCANRDSTDVRNDIKYNYYSYDIKDNLFYKYVSRTKIAERE